MSPEVSMHDIKKWSEGRWSSIATAQKLCIYMNEHNLKEIEFRAQTLVIKIKK